MGSNKVQWLVDLLTGQSIGRQSQFCINMAEQAVVQQVDGELRFTIVKGRIEAHFAPRERAA